MSDYYEIDFLQVDSVKSADAITIRYERSGRTSIHVVDGGFQDTGEKILSHLDKYYQTRKVDHVVVTHNDNDHTGGIRDVLEKADVLNLWMLRPWLYVDELIERFPRFQSKENLAKRLKEIYSNLAALEEIANEKMIPIREPFQGSSIGAFIVVAPTKDRYLNLVADSEKTPESSKDQSVVGAIFGSIGVALRSALWGEEVFSNEETSAKNEMSIVQYTNLIEKTILLTGDAGRGALQEACDYINAEGYMLPINQFQVPHHGSRRNVSSDLLDKFLGQKLPSRHTDERKRFSSVASCSKEDDTHPRKAVIRAMHHRGGSIITTENGTKRLSKDAPKREGWSTAPTMPYPEEQEE